MWDFINQNRSHLEHGGDYEPNKVYPSRRSWKRLNDCLLNAGMLAADNTDTGGVYHLSAAFVGMEAAVAFNDFAQNYERQVTLEMILDDGQVSKTADFGINEHCALIEKMEASDTFKDSLEDNQIQNLADYFVMLPSEAAMKLWTVLGKGDNTNVIGLHKATSSDGTKVSARMVQMLTGKDS